jgi:catechol 2,3-dioxygenase-like lactoylglutathione lyase family enzyme
MSDIGLTHVALPARDLGESAVFYERFAHMHVVHRREGVLWLSDKTRPFVIVLVESDHITPLEPFAHLGVGCASREEVDVLCSAARDEGCLISGPEDSGPPVGYWALIRDPDGHTLEVSHGQDVGLAVEQADR